MDNAQTLIRWKRDATNKTKTLAPIAYKFLFIKQHVSDILLKIRYLYCVPFSQSSKKQENDVIVTKTLFFNVKNSYVSAKLRLVAQAIKVIVPCWVQTQLRRSQSAFMKPPSDWIIKVSQSRGTADCFLMLLEPFTGWLGWVMCGDVWRLPWNSRETDTLRTVRRQNEISAVPFVWLLSTMAYVKR